MDNCETDIRDCNMLAIQARLRPKPMFGMSLLIVSLILTLFMVLVFNYIVHSYLNY